MLPAVCTQSPPLMHEVQFGFVLQFKLTNYMGECRQTTASALDALKSLYKISTHSK